LLPISFACNTVVSLWYGFLSYQDSTSFIANGL
jgi:hypothetical protein